MKVIKNSLRPFKKIDIFGEKYTFKYKNHEKYSTGLGGIIFLILCLLGVTISILNLIPFCKRENISLQFYTVKQSETENIPLDGSVNFAVGLDCNVDQTTHITGKDLFDLQFKFTKKYKEPRMTEERNLITIFLNESSFYNENKENFDYLETKDFQTLNLNDIQDLAIEGIYTDKIFSYISISVISKESTSDHFEKINDYLLKNECRLQFYYSDITVNISNYKQLSKPFIDSTFLQLNPQLLMKKNLFFMKYHFKYDTRLFPILDSESEEEEKIGFSRNENYFIYKGLDRDDEIPDFLEYAKLYIRVDNKKVEIKKKYQSFLEFWADNSSLWIDIFQFINFIVSFIYYYKSNRILSKKLFIFEENSNNKIHNLQITNTINKSRLRASHFNINLNSIRTNNNNTEGLSKSIRVNRRNEKILRTKSIYTAEFFKVSFCSCCKKKEHLKFKEKLIKQSTDILEKKLDIFIYIRNMILIDIMYQILIDDNNKDYFNFLSRTLNYKDQEYDEKEEEVDDIYKPTRKLNLDKLYDTFNNLVTKKESEQTETEKKILALFDDKS